MLGETPPKGRLERRGDRISLDCQEALLTVRLKTDTEILKDVLAELDWDPKVDATDAGVEVDDGAVTLTGTVESFTER